MNSPIGRKKRTEKLLKEMGIPINTHLHTLESENSLHFKDIEQVIDRIIAITIVSAKGSGAPDETIDEFLESYNAKELFSPEEKEFIENEEPDQDEYNTYSWKIECNSALLWAINLIPDLPFPHTLSDVETLYDLVLHSTKEELLERASYRDKNEILDALDLLYRLHWAIAETRMNNEEFPIEISPGVVYERRYALNWMINILDEEWDDISMDTI
ncbi:DUF4272 domain-containing protein [Pradoshia sp. D12]|uniref:DUF4272 domain-containing protein n=1 Tax=Bacillaceae TaxID=186817 RepID=UPI00080AE9AA|nr:MULTISPECIES: DUF4272 domain-containing protein [Bacillaceae]OCA84779.1 hypothetical protein A8L44_10375 [Bacillus sp. FJAT-27986]QFK72755.1 DUF4272 domain-containing protein [Pradoshia sp. D12]TPF71749.1 DUF4272 domain-containing protein [Bacillus sp. D12]